MNPKANKPASPGGLTKRELFALVAMHGIMTGIPDEPVTEAKLKSECAAIAESALFYADALLSVLHPTLPPSS